MNEQELIKALQSGSESAFHTLVDTYKDRLYNTILGFISNGEDAEDVLQEVFIKVFKNINMFKSDSSISTWMYRIAVTQSLDFIKRQNRKKRGAALLQFFGAAKTAEDDIVENIHPGVIAENRERASILFKAMKHLSENQRAAFVLHKIEGLSQQEIAEVLNVSTGAVESLLSRAKQQLKTTLTTYYYEK